MEKSLDKTLEKELRKLREEPDEFVEGMFVYLKEDEDKKEVLEAIQYGDIRTSAEALMWAFDIYREKYELRDLLENICDDEEFIERILAMARSEEEKDTLAVAIQNEEIKTPEEIYQFALTVCKNE